MMGETGKKAGCVVCLFSILALTLLCEFPRLVWCQGTVADSREKLDQTLGRKDANGRWVWYDVRHLNVEGKGWTDTDQFFHRLSAKAKGVVADAYWKLGQQTAGMCVRFRTDADRISLRWTLTSAELTIPFMSDSGASGLDVYFDDGGRWRWLRVALPRSKTSEWLLADAIPAGTHTYLLYFPLYNGLDALEIGIPPGSMVAKGVLQTGDGASPICFYGTSIVQGAFASRAGMPYPAILGRRLRRPVLNLGFNGQGRMEPELATILAELKVAAYVIDGVPNMKPDEVVKRTEPFVMTLRKARPDTPIILLESAGYLAGWFLPRQRSLYEPSNKALRDAYNRLAAKGVGGLWYVPRESLLGADGEDTVDGLHPSDLGFLRMADALEPLLRQVLKNR
jgi:hypothetical protein